MNRNHRRSQTEAFDFEVSNGKQTERDHCHASCCGPATPARKRERFRYPDRSADPFRLLDLELGSGGIEPSPRKQKPSRCERVIEPEPAVQQLRNAIARQNSAAHPHCRKDNRRACHHRGPVPVQNIGPENQQDRHTRQHRRARISRVLKNKQQKRSARSGSNHRLYTRCARHKGAGLSRFSHVATRLWQN